ncbi:hypothetical protein XELAEV_18003203mg [Xenopus laevis]|nr:hypothetical protein XELAEV_18003203mg [Xenopus laevis]
MTNPYSEKCQKGTTHQWMLKYTKKEKFKCFFASMFKTGNNLCQVLLGAHNMASTSPANPDCCQSQLHLKWSWIGAKMF